MTTPTCRAASADERARERSNAGIADRDEAFRYWFMQQSKMPYRSPEEVAGMGWDAALAWAAARSALALEAVPIGFVLVPKEPTEEMLLAMYAADWDASASNRRDLARLRMEPAYRAMLASAPQPQSGNSDAAPVAE